MRLLARIFDGNLEGAPFWASVDAVVGPECVPVVEDPIPAVDANTQRLMRGEPVVEGGGTWVRWPWIIAPLSAEEIADVAEASKVKELVPALAGAIDLCDQRKATIGQLNDIMAKVLRYIARQIKAGGLPAVLLVGWAVALGFAGVVARGAEPITNLTVRWREPASNAIPISAYTVRITGTNVNGFTNESAAPITVNVLGRTTTNAPFVIPNPGPWVVQVRAVNEVGLVSPWSVPLVFSSAPAVDGVEVRATITVTLSN